MAEARRGTARWGEALAAAFLRLKGYRVEARNWRCSLGEIDIIARDRGTLVFVEVKARTGESAGPPEEAVDQRKQRRLIQLAQAYLAKCTGQPACRFDVIAIKGTFPLPRIRHFRDAFRADGLT
ncbi:MAG: YraN family protein [Thermoanaerobaculales bacterium]